MNTIHKAYVINIDVKDLGNKTFLARIVNVEHEHGVNRTMNDTNQNEDSLGAVFYVCAVLIIYGLSIFLMIGSLVKKSMTDHGLSSYMKEWDKLKQLEKKHNTIRTRMIVENITNNSPKVFPKKQKNDKPFSRGGCNTVVNSNAAKGTEIEIEMEPVRGRAATISFPINRLFTTFPSNSIANMQSSGDNLGQSDDSVFLHCTSQQQNSDLTNHVIEIPQEIHENQQLTAFFPHDKKTYTAAVGVQKNSSSSLVQLQPLLEADEET